MPERSQFSPDGQEAYTGTRLENIMLRRIGRRVMLLPEKFDEKTEDKRLRVHGARSELETIVKLDKSLKGQGEGPMRFTDITISHAVGATAIYDLRAEQYETDEEGDRMGVEPARQRFVLGAPNNDISLYNVMRTMTHAEHTVEWAHALRHLATAPDPTYHDRSFTQLF